MLHAKNQSDRRRFLEYQMFVEFMPPQFILNVTAATLHSAAISRGNTTDAGDVIL
jgi:hypothetical protein